MSAPGLWRQIGVALLLSAIGAVMVAALVPAFGAATVWRGVSLMLSAAYVGVLLHGAQARVGHIVSAGAWLALCAFLFALDPPLWVWLLMQVALIWLLRCLYRYQSLLPALADAALSAFALIAAFATASHTRSAFLALWTFFLVQALAVLIPAGIGNAANAPAEEDPFDQAFRTAEGALRRMSVRS